MLPIIQTAGIAARPRSFYGWWIVLTSALGLLLGPIPISIFSFAVFLQPWAQEFHASRGAVSLARTVHSTILPLGLPFAGQLLDRYGARRVVLPSTIFAGMILLSAYFSIRSLPQLYFFYLVLGLATCGAGPLQYCNVVSHWFDRRRGLALGVTMLGLGVGALITPLAAQYLIATVGWRPALSLFGAAALVVTVPAIAILLRDRPESMGLTPDGAAAIPTSSQTSNEDTGLSWHQTWRSSTFWVLFCAFFLVSSTVQACFSHIAAILVDRGSSAGTAALATSLFGGGVLAGRGGSGYLLDRFFAPRVAAAIFGIAALGIGLLRITSSLGIASTAAFFIGLGLGAEVDIMAYLTSRYFGLRAFGTIYGVIFAGFGLAGGLGTYLMGAAYDAGSSYAVALDVCCLVTSMGAIILMRLGLTDIRPVF
jgi:predicted MFS family arabinose efflux permease